MSIASPTSFEAAVARARASTPRASTLAVVASLAALAPAELDRSAFEHNAGDCGCGGGSQCGGPGQCVCRVPGGGGDVYFRRMPDGTMVAVPAPSGDMVVTVPSLPPDGQRPRDFPATDWERYRDQGFPSDCVPYKDAIRDALRMVPVVSNIATIAAAASAVLTFAPPQGWLDAYYIDFVARTAAGALVDPAGYTVSYPVVAGCPASSCIPTTAINATFMVGAGGGQCCNGRPFRAIVQRAADGGVLTTTVTNNTAADIVVQGVIRGFCVSNRICV